MMPTVRAATRKQQQTQRVTDALRGYMKGYKDWLQDALGRDKLTLPQLRLLDAIQEGQGKSAASIARSLMVTPQTLQTMLERAVREQWIVRAPAAGNQRVLTATLTARGEAVLTHGRELSAQFDREVWAGVGADVLRQCAETLERGVANMEQVRAAEGGAQESPIAPGQKRLKQTARIAQRKGAGRH